MKKIFSIGMLGFSLLVGGCNNDSSSSNTSISNGTNADSFTLQTDAIALQSSETSEPVAIDSIALTESETREPAQIAIP
ncbi:MAG: hypothetical protein V4525_04200 [Pseudomonadota bacterium]